MQRELAASFIRQNYDFLKGMYIKETTDSDFGFYSYSSADYDDTGVFWNHAVLLQKIDDLEEKIAEVDEFYQDRGKASAFYVPVVEPTEEVLDSLKKEGFGEVFTDVWMFYTGEDLPKGNPNVELTEVSSESEMEEFVDLFYRSHAADLEDPYAGLSETYGEQLKRKFGGDFDGFQLQHFIVRNDGEPVGHVTFAENGDAAAIYNLGTIPDYRGKGIATAAFRETVQKLEGDVDQIFLQTEKGSKNEEFFSSRGFETKFEAECVARE